MAAGWLATWGHLCACHMPGPDAGCHRMYLWEAPAPALASSQQQ